MKAIAFLLTKFTVYLETEKLSVMLGSHNKTVVHLNIDLWIGLLETKLIMGNIGTRDESR